MMLRIEGKQWDAEWYHQWIPCCLTATFHMKGPYVGTSEEYWEVTLGELTRNGKTGEQLRDFLVKNANLSATELIEALNAWWDAA